jgi:hypothetical protein
VWGDTFHLPSRPAFSCFMLTILHMIDEYINVSVADLLNVVKLNYFYYYIQFAVYKKNLSKWHKK